MLGLLKTFGKGILYVIGLPFFLVALVLFAVFGILAFIFQIIKSIIVFFTGRKFFPELPEDKELRLLKEAANQHASQEPVEQQSVDNSQSIITPLVEEEIIQEEPVAKPAPSIEETVFIESEEETISDNKKDDPEDPEGGDHVFERLIEEEPEEEIIEEETETEEEAEPTVLETAETNDEEDLVEELETYVPRSSNYDNQIEDDDEDTDSGVDIDYDVR